MKRRKLLLASAVPMLAAAADKPMAWPNVVLDPAKAKKVPDPSGDLLIYHEGPTDQLKLMVAGSLKLKAGMSPHPPHTHPEEEFMLVTEGTGWIEIEGQRTNVGPGALMYCAANKPHAIKNTGKTPMLFYFYKWKA